MGNEFVIKNGFISKGDSEVQGSLTATTYYGDGSNLSGTTPWSQSGTSIYYNDGNVGIGVSDPTFNLDIVSSGGTSSFENISRFRTIDSTDYLAITNAVSTDGSFNPVIRSFNNTNTSTNLYIQSVIDPSVDTGVNPLIMLQGRVNTEPGVDPWSGVTTRPIVRVRNNSTNLLDVTADGKVGIGTTTPSHKLSILGSNGSFETRVDGSLPYTSEIYTKTTNPSGSSVVQIVNDNVSSIVMGVLGSNRDASIAYGGESDDAFIFASTAANNLHIFNNSGTGTEDSIKFYAGNTATSTPHLHIQGSGSTKGYVGIGTETPIEKLDVVGNTKISGTLNIGTLGTGTSVTNLGIDASGNVVSGDTGGEVNTGSNLGTGTGLFAQKSDTDLQFKSLTSTGGTVTITSDSNTVNIESASTDIYVTGGTYSSGTLTLDRNDGNSVSVSGFTSGNATVENYYYQISNSVDTRPIFQDSFVTINWDETGNDLEFQMDVAPGGSGDMRSLAYLVGGATQNTFITTTATPYDVYAAGVAAGNRLECFITAENDDTYPAYHITVYNTGESFLNSVWIKKIIKN